MKKILLLLFVFASLYADAQIQYLGAPNVTVVNRGNFRIDSILYLPKREKTPTDTGALRYQISDSSLYVWTGNAWRKAKNDGTLTSVSAGTGMSFTTITSSGSVSADTNVLATKSYRQKGDDSLGAIIATKGTGTVTSVGTGYGINGGTITTTGTLTADTLNLATRLRLQKVGDSLGVLISEAGGGTVTGVSAGTGMSFTTITSSGAVNADTLVLSTRSWRQKGIDSVSSLVAAKLNISDTATMLGNYIRHAGYGLLKSGQALLVDTASIATRSRVQKGIDSLGAVKQNVLTNPVVGVGTINRMVKFNASGSIGNASIVDSSSTVRMTILANGNIGISTATPTTRFSLNAGDASFGDGTNDFYFNANTGAAGKYYYLQNGGIRTTMLPSGDFGIGTASPAYRLDVSGTLRNTTGAAFATSSGNVLVGTTTDGGSYKLDVQGALRTTGNAFLATTGTSAYVGYTSDALAESGRGFLGINGTNNSLISMRFGGTTLSGYIYGTSDSYMFASNARPIVFNTGSVGGSERMRIHNNGNISVNTTADNGISFDISGTLRSTLGANFATASGNVGIGVLVPSEKLEVVGRVRVRTIDSTGTGTAMNMLYSDATGVIKKAAVPSGGSGTVTSVATGFGLSGGTITTTGTLLVDSASVATRARVQKGIDSVAAIAVKGTGISGYFPKWTGTATQDTSQLFQLGRNIGIGTASPLYRLHLPDAGATANQAMIAGTIFGSDGNGITISPNSSNITIKGGQGNGSIYSGTISSVARWGINTTSISDAVLSINGDVKIVTVDSTSTARNMLYQDANGMIKKSAVPTGSGTIATAESDISSNYTVTSTDHFVFLPALEGAGRNIVLPNDAVNGRQLIFFNTSNDGSHRWTFTNEDVEDTAGAAVTTLTNRKVYMLVYYESKFRVVSVY